MSTAIHTQFFSLTERAYQSLHSTLAAATSCGSSMELARLKNSKVLKQTCEQLSSLLNARSYKKASSCWKRQSGLLSALAEILLAPDRYSERQPSIDIHGKLQRCVTYRGINAYTINRRNRPPSRSFSSPSQREKKRPFWRR